MPAHSSASRRSSSRRIDLNKNSTIYVAGHRGLVGSAIVRKLHQQGYTHVITRSRRELDLTDRDAAMSFFAEHQPEYLFGAAAKVGGILANDTYPADFIRENMMIQANLMDAVHQYHVGKYLMLGSSCIYSRLAPQPIREDYLLTGPLEPTNEAYAIAKIAGIILARSFRRQYGVNTICLMPTNLYGPGDNFDPRTSHVLPAMMRKFHEAKINGESFVTIWGTGTPRREFLHVDDLADAAVFLMSNYDMSNYDSPDIINVGTGEDLSIKELAVLVGEITGFIGEIRFDTSKPDGTPRKQLDVSRLRNAGWTARKQLRDGIDETYKWYLQHREDLGVPNSAFYLQDALLQESATPYNN